MGLWVWALWGLGGAFGYASPRLLAALFEPPTGGGRPLRAWVEFAFAMGAGPIAAAGLGPFAASELHSTSIAECRAGAVVIGLLVNPVAPAAVELLTSNVLRWLGHPLADRKPKP